MPKRIDGKKIARTIRARIKKDITRLGIHPGLAVILAGDNPASKLYVFLKEKAANEVGIHFKVLSFRSHTPEKRIIQHIQTLNSRSDIHGILVQLPLPKHLNTKKIIRSINPKKDVDGFHPLTIQFLNTPKETIKPVLAEALLEIFFKTKQNLLDKTLLIVGNSKEFLKPLITLFSPLCKNVLTANKKNFHTYSPHADILVVAVGSAWIIQPEHIKKNVTLIDIGINTCNGKVLGDIDPACYKKSRFYTPVPGGVGPVTVAKLLENTYKLALQSIKS